MKKYIAPIVPTAPTASETRKRETLQNLQNTLLTLQHLKRDFPKGETNRALCLSISAIISKMVDLEAKA